MLKGLIYKNLQNAAEGCMAPRPMVPTAVIWVHIIISYYAYRHPNCYTPLGRIFRIFAGFYWELLLIPLIYQSSSLQAAAVLVTYCISMIPCQSLRPLPWFSKVSITPVVYNFEKSNIKEQYCM